MSFSLTQFAKLIEQYSSWPELKAHLQSKEGGNLRIVEPANSDLCIVRYVKGVSDFSKENVRLFRSVVWNKSANRPVCVAPVKAEMGNSVPLGTPLRISDFVDGTMINAFRLNDSSDAVITSRSSIGAGGSFYSSRSFAELLNDATRQNGGTVAFLNSVLPARHFVSLVLQHPEHKIVGTIPVARIFVSQYGFVEEDGTVRISTSPLSWPSTLASLAPQVFEESKVFSGAADAEAMMSRKQRSHMWQGMVFQDMNSYRRWRIRNPSYTAVRNLRGSESDAFERFMRLRTQGKVKEYLSYFREESNDMWKMEQAWRSRTQDLYNAYVDMNKLKKVTMKEIHLPLRVHVYALHGQYLASLPKPEERGQKYPITITKEYVIDYVNGLTLEQKVQMMK
jgi:hypothetical protein